MTTEGGITSPPATGPCSEAITQEDLLCDVCRVPVHGHAYSERTGAWAPFRVGITDAEATRFVDALRGAP